LGVQFTLAENEKGRDGEKGEWNFIRGQGTAWTMVWNPRDKGGQAPQSCSQQLQNVFLAFPFSQTLARMAKGDVGRDI